MDCFAHEGVVQVSDKIQLIKNMLDKARQSVLTGPDLHLACLSL